MLSCPNCRRLSGTRLLSDVSFPLRSLVPHPRYSCVLAASSEIGEPGTPVESQLPPGDVDEEVPRPGRRARVSVAVRDVEPRTDPRVNSLIPERTPDKAVLTFSIRKIEAQESIWTRADSEEPHAAVLSAEGADSADLAEHHDPRPRGHGTGRSSVDRDGREGGKVMCASYRCGCQDREANHDAEELSHRPPPFPRRKGVGTLERQS
jgi:hypothetical protein